MTVRIFVHLPYFLHLLDYSYSFAIGEENEDFTNVAKAIEYNLIIIEGTFNAYIRGDDQGHFDLFDLLLLFIECFKRVNFGCFVNFNCPQTIFIYLFILIYFFEFVKLLLVPLTDFRNHFQILKNLYRILP